TGGQRGRTNDCVSSAGAVVLTAGNRAAEVPRLKPGDPQQISNDRRPIIAAALELTLRRGGRGLLCSVESSDQAPKLSCNPELLHLCRRLPPALLPVHRHTSHSSDRALSRAKIRQSHSCGSFLFLA